MHAIAEPDAPHLHDVKLPPGIAILTRFPPHADHAVGDTLQLLLAVRHGAVVEHQHRALFSGKKLLQPQNLPAVAGTGLRQNFQFGHGIERHTRRFQPFYFGAHALCRFSQFHVRRMVDRIVRFFLQPLGERIEFQQIDAVERPSVGLGHLVQLLGGFRKGYVQNPLTQPDAFAQKLQCQRGLAGSRIALNHIDAILRKSAREGVVEAWDAGKRARHSWRNSGLRAVFIGCNL